MLFFKKKKFIRGNQAPFMKRELQKEIYIRSKLRNSFWQEPQAANKAAYKKTEKLMSKNRKKK